MTDNFPFPTYDQILSGIGDYTMDWLYGTEWNERKVNQYLLLKNIPLTSWAIDYAEGKKQMQEYMSRYGLSYGDIHHMSKMPGVGSMSSGIGHSLNYVSTNLKRLYR